MNNLKAYSHQLNTLFSDNNLTLEILSDRAVVGSSTFVTAQTIQLIVESLTGFSLLFSENDRLSFTIFPCSLPTDFKKSVGSTETSYFTPEEVHELLKKGTIDKKPLRKCFYDPFDTINKFRMGVYPAIEGLLSDILAEKSKGLAPIVEIGSGDGYSFSSSLKGRIIRTQPEWDPASYPVNAEELCDILGNRGKHVPLFFAIDVFDVITPEVRRKSLEKLGTLQSPGDKTLIFLDTNPFLNAVVEEIQGTYSNYSVYPYFTLDRDNFKHAVLLVPSELNFPQLNFREFHRMLLAEVPLIQQGKMSPVQVRIHQLQKEHSLRILYIEDFFVEQAKRDLKRAGYQPEVHVISSFTRGKSQPGIEAQTDLVYKSITGARTLRQWTIGSGEFDALLQLRKMQAPVLKKEYPAKIKEKGQIILGTEILMIEGTKL